MVILCRDSLNLVPYLIVTLGINLFMKSHYDKFHEEKKVMQVLFAKKNNKYNNDDLTNSEREREQLFKPKACSDLGCNQRRLSYMIIVIFKSTIIFVKEA